MSQSRFWKAPPEALSFPRLLMARQPLISRPMARIEEELKAQFDRLSTNLRIRPGMNVAVGVGSRGITQLSHIVLAVLNNLKRLGARPFMVPAMGSHGGATVEGQREVLASYGITEESMHTPIHATMEVVELARTAENLPVFFDAIAAQADGIVVVNRIKLHTDFRGDYESGLLKMLAIGLGKQRGAKVFHQQGFDRFHELIPRVSTLLLDTLPVLCGVAIVEDGHHQPAIIEVVPSGAILEREKELLKEAKRMLPRIPFPEIDVLIVGEMGKNISGCGMDPNVTGRFLVPPLSLQRHSPQVERITALSLTSETHGNALGVGAADAITRLLYEAIDYPKTSANADTAGEVAWARVPIVAETDRDAIALVLRTARRVQPETARLVWIRNTLELENLYVSEVLSEAHPDAAEWLAPPSPMCFDAAGRLTPPSWSVLTRSRSASSTPPN